MIHNVRYRNFKGLRHVDLDLEQLTVIVGPNSSGKTSILEGMSCLARQDVPDASSVYNCNAVGELALQFSGVDWELRLRASPPPGLLDDRRNHRPPVGEYPWTFKISGRDRGTETPEWGRLPESTRLAAVVPSATLLHLDAARLAAPSYSETHPPTIDASGDGLASVLAYMALNQPDDFQRLQESLRGIVPSVRRIRFDRARVEGTEYRSVEVNGEWLFRKVSNSVWGNSLLLDTDGGGSIPGPLASEGTILVLGLLTVLMGPVRPRLILLDDLERGLHPRAQENLVVFLRRFLDQNSETQIVATTHSPLLLNHVKAQEVRLTTLKADGTTACGRLDEHPEFDEWKDAMAPGEFWSLIGEGWLRESRTEERV